MLEYVIVIYNYKTTVASGYYLYEKQNLTLNTFKQKILKVFIIFRNCLFPGYVNKYIFNTICRIIFPKHLILSMLDRLDTLFTEDCSLWRNKISIIDLRTIKLSLLSDS